MARAAGIAALERIRPAVVADALAELQVRWPEVPIVFCETRALAEEWTYRYLAAAVTWAESEGAAQLRSGTPTSDLDGAPTAPDPPTATVRAWARKNGLAVPDRGRLRPEVWAAWREQPR